MNIALKGQENPGEVWAKNSTRQSSPGGGIYAEPGSCNAGSGRKVTLSSRGKKVRARKDTNRPYPSYERRKSGGEKKKKLEVKHWGAKMGRQHCGQKRESNWWGINREIVNKEKNGGGEKRGILLINQNAVKCGKKRKMSQFWHVATKEKEKSLFQVKK